MQILFDHNVPYPLRPRLEQLGCTVHTAQYMGWERLQNGDLAAEAEKAGYNAVITFDQGFWEQKPRHVINLACVLLSGEENRAVANAESISAAIETVPPGQLVEVYLG